MLQEVFVENARYFKEIGLPWPLATASTITTASESASKPTPAHVAVCFGPAWPELMDSFGAPTAAAVVAALKVNGEGGKSTL